MKTSLWLSVDPLADYNPHMNSEHYIDGQHNGGVYNSFNQAVYSYCYQNPIKYIDPNGKQSLAAAIQGTVKMGIKILILLKAGTDCGGDCQSWFSSNYIGPSVSESTAIKQRESGVEPVDEVDLAAYNHDVAYDKIQAAGVKGAVVDLETLPADIKLLSDAKKVAEKYNNDGTDSVTGYKISLVTALRADAVIKAFEPLIKEKEARIYLAEQVKKGKENVKMTTENAKNSLMNPVVW